MYYWPFGELTDEQIAQFEEMYGIDFGALPNSPAASSRLEFDLDSGSEEDWDNLLDEVEKRVEKRADKEAKRKENENE